MYFDIHSHLLPGIDDGCANLDECLQCIQALQARGFAGSICTPHHWPDQYPHITPEHVAIWTDDLRRQLADAGVDYPIQPGGELRLCRNAIDWMKVDGVPTLGRSRYVLMDFWEGRWQKHIDLTSDWLLAENYTPILAHPERSVQPRDVDKRLLPLAERGVLLQCNTASYTGTNGPHAEQLARRLIQEDRLSFLALDMHRPETLQCRLEGIAMARELAGDDTVARLIGNQPRELVFDATPSPHG